jgi:dipeptidyl aminopeptidase/acylaminoacyl peptidase
MDKMHAFTKKIQKGLLIVYSFLMAQGVYAQQVSEDVYRNAAYFLSDNIQKEIFHLEVVPNWVEGQNAFWHQTYTQDGKKFFYTDVSKQVTGEAFDHRSLAALMGEVSILDINDRDLPIHGLKFHSASRISFTWDNKNWVYDKENNTLKPSVEQKQENPNGISPDGKWRAFTKDFNLYLENLETGKVEQLSHHGKRDFEYASSYGWSDLIKGEVGNRLERFFVSWSPDSKKLFTQIVDFRLAEKMYLLDFSQDEKFRPELLSYYRGSPGDTTVVYYLPVIFDVENKKETVIQALKAPHFMGLNFRWNGNSNKLEGMVFQRGYKQMDFIEINAIDGSCKSLFTVRSDTFVENTQLFLEIGKDRFIISSEKSGYKHLYLIDRSSGNLLRQLTSGNFVVTKIHHWDEKQDWLYFEATGREKGRNPYYPHLYKIKLNGTEMTLLTPEDAFHDIQFSKERYFFVDNLSKVDQPTSSVLRELETGKVIMEISRADISNLTRRGYQFPRPFSARAKDGKTEIHGVYFLPADFDPGKRYPVIDYTYTGPHTAITPKTFKAAVMGLQQSFAELGFVVVTVDGLGTAGRGKVFQNFSYKNLGDGTTDHVLAIRELAEKVSFLDIDRVGIFGHSAGGYDAARAMLLHPDFYKVGVASAGDHDHRMEKAWWPEMYMGYPVGGFYHDQSNVTNAANLKGRLLLAHGAIDENVNPSATYKFAEALVNAGKDFDLFIWPSRNHSFGRTNGDYFTKKRWDYFIQHLLGKEPLLHYNGWN